jgi:hypothetical protein
MEAVLEQPKDHRVVIAILSRRSKCHVTGDLIA